MADIVQGKRLGVATAIFDVTTQADALEEMRALAALDTVPRCVAAAQPYFSLNEGVRRYALIYLHLDKARK